MKKHLYFACVPALIAILGIHGLARGQTNYCTANASYQAQYISSVHVGSIYNITLLSPGGYEKDTVLWTAMTIGTGYPITITNGFGFATDQCAIWVDWNHDKDFTDSGEPVTVTGTPGLGPYTATITPPAAALSGNTRMRVRLSAAGSFNSCGTTMYGETEDYTINVGGTPPVNDIGVINITAPVTGTTLGATETVKVMVNNFGTSSQTGFPVTYQVDNGTPVTETVSASVAAGASYIYTFTQKANMSGLGVTYALKAYTSLTGDENNYNDTTARNIFHAWAQYQKVVQGEYFINTDPGEGLGTAITGTYNLVDVTVNFTNLNLPVGSTLYVRFKSTSGKWSYPRSYKRGAYLTNSNASLASAEYFINTDPGEGNGTPTSITGGIANITNLNLPVGSTVYVRAKDNMGRWGKPRGMKRIIYFPNPGATLNYAEYFINTDPGQGNGIPVTVTGGIINLTNLELPVGSKVYVRVRDNLNRWSQPYGMIRYVHYTIQGAELSYGEYFIDTDPGQGNAIPMTMSGGIINLNDMNIPVGSVIYIRVKDNFNRWSLPRGFERPVEIITPGSVLAGGEYFINNDPGKGNGIPLTFVSGITQIDSLLFQYGDILYVRAKDDYNRWGPSRALKYQFKNMQGASYKIKLASDSSTTLPLPMILYPDPDSTCTWIATKDSLTWHDNDTIWVRFQDEDGFYSSWKRGVLANAGEDQTICAGNYATLTASGGSSYLWSDGQAGASIMVNPAVTTQYWVLISDGAGASSMDSVMVFVDPVPYNPGPIAGMADICSGSTVTVYTIAIIENATSYIWTLPPGATGSSATNSIQVTYTGSASSGNITVRGSNSCGQGPTSSLAIQVNNSIAGPAGSINGPAAVCSGANDVTYSIPAISNATSYIWTLPAGVTGSSTSNVIVVDFGVSFNQGTITARGTNSCGDGIPSVLSVESMVADSITWTGNAGVAWNDPGNWNGCGLPDINTHVIIPNVSPRPFPVVSGTVYCKSLSVETGAILTVASGGSVTVGDGL